jgi:hypothetical protein
MPIEATHHGVSGGSERRKREHVTSTASDTFFLRFFHKSILQKFHTKKQKSQAIKVSDHKDKKKKQR